MSRTSEYLNRAANFCEARGDYKLFDEKYSFYREQTNIRDSIWLTIREMYGEESADLLEQSNIIEV
jgi:hypothetical protein